MGKAARARKEWVAIRYPKRKEGGPRKESDLRTHRQARGTAGAWYEDGYRVELQRRRATEKAHVLVPKFPGIDRRRQRAG